MLDITLDDLISVLGVPTRTTGHQYYFRCPACAQHGGDTSGDNLLYNDKKQLLKCFACDEGSVETLKMINNRKKSFTPTATHHCEQRSLWWQKNFENLYIYMVEANEEMTEEVSKWLWEKHGISKDIIKLCSIGYDNNPQLLNIGASVTFPLLSINHDLKLVGFELRQVGEQKIIKHTLDAPSCLCVVADSNKANCLVICEGFKDAYCLCEFLHMRHILGHFTILTPAHGVRDIYKNLDAIRFNRYAHHYLILDNDQAGTDETDKIIDKYHFFKDRRDLIDGYKDIAEWWMATFVRRR